MSATGGVGPGRAVAADGALTPVAWLRDGARTVDAPTPGDWCAARGWSTVARSMAKSAARGELSSGHVEAWARHVTPPRADLFDDHADALVDATATLTRSTTAAAARRWASHADDLFNRGEPDDLHAQRGVWVPPHRRPRRRAASSALPRSWPRC